MITTKNKNLLIIAVIAVTTSIIAATFASTYIQQGASAQNKNSSNGSIGSTSAVPPRNLTGSVQAFPRLSQVIHSKANVSLSEAATSAEKAAGVNSRVISAHLGIANGSLVYIAHVVNANNNIHRVIIDAGNGKVLSAVQLPFANALIQPHERGIFGHYYGSGWYKHSQGLLPGHHGLNGNTGPRM